MTTMDDGAALAATPPAEDRAVPRRSMIEAVRDALDVAMARDPRVVVFGEDVGYFGGVFR